LKYLILYERILCFCAAYLCLADIFFIYNSLTLRYIDRWKDAECQMPRFWPSVLKN